MADTLYVRLEDDNPQTRRDVMALAVRLGAMSVSGGGDTLTVELRDTDADGNQWTDPRRSTIVQHFQTDPLVREVANSPGLLT